MCDTTQKEYLRKYLSIGKDRTGKKKKKKNKQSTIPSRLTIIDDNADSFQTAVQEDLLEDDNAPQIVAIIDERPPSLQIDEESHTNMWIPIGNLEIKTELNPSSDHKIKTNEDLSPPRFKFPLLSKTGGNVNILPQRKEITSGSKLDDKKNKIIKMQIVPDMSPPRKRKGFTPRTKSGISPPGDRKESILPNVSEQNESIEHLAPPRSKVAKRNGNSGDLSPPRPKAPKSSKYDRYISQPKRENFLNTQSEQVIKNEIRECDLSLPRKRDLFEPPKITKTLDGKTAGLQNAEQLAAESIVLKKREEELFNKLSSEISGANASSIIRDKQTGRVWNQEEEAAKELEKRKKHNENKEKYSRWGRGLKQVEDETKKIEEAMTEMHKPLARYANDEDLERYLKEQDREEDPMLAYMRKKRKKKDIEEGKPMKPEYMGEYMPNRFGIKPGYRWDGVDRSNGYEKKWFEIQNSKLAQQEEAYKWSTEDM